MIDLNLFCPFERIVAIVNNQLAGTAIKSYKIDFGPEFGSRTVSTKPLDQALSFTMSQRLKFMFKDREFELDLYLDDGTFERRTGRVLHILRTDEPTYINYEYAGKKVSNARSSSGTEMCYPEALQTIHGVGKLKAPDAGVGKIWEHSFRPFFAYVLQSFNGTGVNEYIICGPNIHTPEVLIGSIRLDYMNSSMNLFQDQILDYDPDLYLTDEPEETNVSTNIQLMKYNFKLKCGEITQDFIFGQTSMLMDGKSVLPSEMFKILKIVGFFEINNSLIENDEVIITLRLSNGSWRLNSEWQNFYELNVENNAYLNEVFDRLSATEEYIYISNKNGHMGRLCGEYTSACFAFALSMYFAQMTGRRWIDLIVCLRQLLDANLIFIDKDQTLTGQTAAKLKNFSRIVITTIDGRYEINVKRESKNILDIENQLVIIGLDPFEGNVTQGVPDHYVLADVIDGKAITAYDPYRKVGCLALGQDLSSYTKQEDFTVIQFLGTVVASTSQPSEVHNV